LGTVKGSFKSSICLFQLQFGDAVVVATRQTFNPSALDQLEAKSLSPGSDRVFQLIRKGNLIEKANNYDLAN